MFFGSVNRGIWFIILIIALFVLLFPDFDDTTSC